MTDPSADSEPMNGHDTSSNDKTCNSPTVKNDLAEQTTSDAQGVPTGVDGTSAEKLSKPDEENHKPEESSGEVLKEGKNEPSLTLSDNDAKSNGSMSGTVQELPSQSTDSSLEKTSGEDASSAAPSVEKRNFPDKPVETTTDAAGDVPRTEEVASTSNVTVTKPQVVTEDSTQLATAAKPGSKEATPSTSRSATPALADPVEKPQPQNVRVSSLLASSDDPINTYRPYAKNLYLVGHDMVKTVACRDFLRLEGKKSQHEMNGEGDYQKISERFNELKDSVERFTFDTRRCEDCKMATDVDLIFEDHKDYAYDKGNHYACHHCDFSSPIPDVFVEHMWLKHQKKGKISSRRSFFVCAICSFESNGNKQFTRHVEKCKKHYNPSRNLAPTYLDLSFQLKPTPKKPAPPTPAARPTVQPRVARPQITGRPVRPTIASLTRTAQPQVVGAVNRFAIKDPKAMEIIQQAAMKAASIHQQTNPTMQARELVQKAIAGSRSLQTRMPSQGSAASSTNSQIVNIRGTAYQLQMVNNQSFLVPVSSTSSVTSVAGANAVIGKITSSTAKPTTAQTVIGSLITKKSQSQVASKMEACEMCGAFVRDLDSLRKHFQVAHKISLSQNMNRKEACCKYCAERFWSFQGLERHTLKKHRNIMGKNRESSNISAAALAQIHGNFASVNKTPTMICTMCAKPINGKNIEPAFWQHIESHNINQVTIFQARKCLICGLQMNDKALESHLINLHRSFFDYISSKKNKVVPEKATRPVCLMCGIKFTSEQEFESHCAKAHRYQCTRCSLRLSDREHLGQHFREVHGHDEDPCPLCKRKIKIGRPFARHITSEHVKQCSVVVQKLRNEDAEDLLQKYEAGLLYHALQSEEHGTFENGREPLVIVPVGHKSKSTSGPASKRKTEEDIIVIDDDSNTPRKRKKSIIPPGVPKAKRSRITVSQVPVHIDTVQPIEIKPIEPGPAGRNVAPVPRAMIVNSHTISSTLPFCNQTRKDVIKHATARKKTAAPTRKVFRETVHVEISDDDDDSNDAIISSEVVKIGNEEIRIEKMEQEDRSPSVNADISDASRSGSVGQLQDMAGAIEESEELSTSATEEQIQISAAAIEQPQTDVASDTAVVAETRPSAVVEASATDQGGPPSAHSTESDVTSKNEAMDES